MAKKAKDTYRDVFLIIPVYNEGEVVRSVIEQAQKTFPNIVCIDDGSTDNSAEEIQKTGAYFVQHPINMGQGAGLQTGIEFARSIPEAQYFVTFDADGQHRIADVVKMLKVLKEKDLDIVLGSRFLGSHAEKMPWLKRGMFKMAIVFSNLTTGLKLTDTHNGLRVFNRRVADTMQITMSDMAHASEILEIMQHQKFRYAEVPVTISYTEYSTGKGQSVLNAVNIAFDILLKRITR